MHGKSHHVSFDHVRIVPPKGDPKRVITCTADHFHIGQSRGFIKIENCEFSLGADDIVNMHDLTAFARKTGSHRAQRQRSIYAEVYLKTDPSQETTDYPAIKDILIEGNVFRDNSLEKRCGSHD